MLKKILCVSVVVLVLILCAIFFLDNKTNQVSSNGSLKPSISIYSKQANKICGMLQQASKLYQSGQLEKAYILSENSYWDGYDSFLEIKYRPYATPAYIFSVENQFHETSKLMKKPVTISNKKSVTNAVQSLCTEVNKEATYLEKNA